MRRRSVALALALALALAACSNQPAAPADAGAPRPLRPGREPLSLARVAVIGASMSAGGGGTPVLDAFRAAMKPGAGESMSTADAFFFADALANGRAQVDEALRFQPTLVVALDFLFWYAYDDSDGIVRAERLEKGMQELERFDHAGATVIVADLPDMRRGAPWMLPPEKVPSPSQLLAMTSRIHDWAKDRPHVHVFSMAILARPLLTGAAVVLAAGEPPTPHEQLILFDELHPTSLGIWYLLDHLDHELEQAFDTPPDLLRFVRPK